MRAAGHPIPDFSSDPADDTAIVPPWRARLRAGRGPVVSEPLFGSPRTIREGLAKPAEALHAIGPRRRRVPSAAPPEFPAPSASKATPFLDRSSFLDSGGVRFRWALRLGPAYAR